MFKVTHHVFILARTKSMNSIAVWTGANDRGTEGGWKWVYNKPFAFFNWAPGNNAYLYIYTYVSQKQYVLFSERRNLSILSRTLYMLNRNKIPLTIYITYKKCFVNYIK
jgi:hypothetical protein